MCVCVWVGVLQIQRGAGSGGPDLPDPEVGQEVGGILQIKRGAGSGGS